MYCISKYAIATLNGKKIITCDNFTNYKIRKNRHTDVPVIYR